MKLFRAGGDGVAVVMFAMSVLLAPRSNAQINSWISPSSGNWEDPSWLLGQIPGSGQTILITNAGWKAVEIRQATAVNFPQSLAVDSITISSPSNTVNSLLLNFVGTGSPLVANSVTLDQNSVITMHSSALIVQSNLSIGGTFNQNDFSGVTAVNMQVGDIGPANYTLSNGTLTVTNFEVVGSSNHYPVDFDQEGGYHLAASLLINNGGYYELHGGQLGGNIQIQRGILDEWGGDLAASSFSNQGAFNLVDGTFEAPNGITMSGDAFAAQFGGTNSSGSLVMGSTSQENPTGGTYTMVDGVMNLGSATINYLGYLDQQGGAINVTGALNIPDFLFGPSPVHSVFGNFSIEDGTMTAGSINLAGHITQRGGTNVVTGNLNLQDGPADYILNGGFLSTSNTLKHYGAFHQTNGIHSVQKVLHIDNPLAYDMVGGQLIAPDIEIENSTFAHYGGSISNATVLAMNFGWWIERTPSVQLGALRLFGDSSTVSFGTNPCVIRFAASSTQVWSNNAVLNIAGWNGSLNGGGQSQIYVGNNSSGLSASKLAHVQFTFSQGAYPAKILSSGELVPDVSGIPFSPTDLSATARSFTRIDLAWTDNALNEYGYSIERSLDGTNFVQLCAPPANATNYSDTDVSGGATYYYRIQAQSTGGNSDYSNIASATTPASAPTAVKLAPYNGAMQLNVAGPTGVSYEFDISTDLVNWTPWKTQLNDTGVISITDDTATNAPTRYYRTTLIP